MTEPDEVEIRDAEPAENSSARMSDLDFQASKVDTAMVLGWVGLVLVPCFGLGSLVSLFAVIFGALRLRAIRGRDRKLTGRAAGAIFLGLLGVAIGGTIIVWFVMTFLPGLNSDNPLCKYASCGTSD